MLIVSKKKRRGGRGLGLIEVLLCVTISSMLLTAVGAACRSSFNSYKDAQQRGWMLHAARGGLDQITADIRSADSAAPYDPAASIATAENVQFSAGAVPGNPTPGLPSAGGSGVQGVQLLKTHADSRDPGASADNPLIIRYWLDAGARTIYMTREMGAATPTPYPVATSVQSLQIYMQPLLVSPKPQTGTSALAVCGQVVVSVSLANVDSSGERISSDGRQNLTPTFCDTAVPRKMLPGT